MILKIFRAVGVVFFVFLSFNGYSQLTVTPTASAITLASNITGAGVTVLNQVLDCDAPVACGTFTVVPGTLLGTGTTVFGINSGILLTTGHAAAAAGPEAGTTTFNNAFGGDAAMAALALTATTFDRCELSFDFIPMGDTVKFNYIFGSEEYIHSTCGNYDDAFAFFISGPGITGTQNMALVPGTNVPVLVNTINCGVPCVVSGWGVYSNCTSIAPGSPFTSYYTDNTGGSNFAYRGYTTKLPAFHSVTPCDTYHLKMAIVDAGNAGFDSGVFIEANSLTSNTYSFDHADSVGATINGMPHTIVKGCTPTTVEVIAAHASSSNQTVFFTFGGTAVNGVDVATVPSSAVILAGDTSVLINITGLPTLPLGTKTFTIYLNAPVGCGTGDSITINVMDTPSAFILTPDTAICPTSFTIRTQGTTGLVYNWAPTTGLSSPTVAQPIATPTVTTTYVMTATLPGSGCPPINRSVTVTVNNLAINLVTPDTTICLGDSVQLVVTSATSNTYLWSPAAGLNNSTLQDPIAYPMVTTTYSVTASSPLGCPPVTKTVTITVPNVAITLMNKDTTICFGDAIPLTVLGSASNSYIWTPPTGLSNATVQNPIASPTITTTYTVTATSASCFSTASITITVDSPAIATTITDTICLGVSDSINLSFPGSSGYMFTWNPTTFLTNDTLADQIITPTAQGSYSWTVTVKPRNQNCGVTDLVNIFVAPNSFTISPIDTAVCLGGQVQVRSIPYPLFSYQWIPTSGVSISNIVNPLIIPDTSSFYVVTAYYRRCPDMRDTLFVDVQPNPIVNIGGNRFLCMHDTIHITADVVPHWYSHYSYHWTSNTSVDDSTANDVVFLDTATQKIVVAVTTPAGCWGKDSATINTYPGEFLIPLQDRNFCPGDTGVLNATANIPNVSFRWLPPLYLSDSTGANPVIRPVTSASYTVIGTSLMGCTDTMQFNVNVHPGAMLFLGDSLSIYTGESVLINTESNCTFFNWFPSYGLSNPTSSNPIASPNYDTKYIVIGKTDWGCVAKDSISIYVDPGSLIDIPNAFTPGNGPNSVFKIIRRGLVTLNYFRIFNRWGEVIFETNDFEQGWDGNYKGAPQPFGVFVYMMEAVAPSGKIIEKHGNVTLIR